MAEIKIRNNQSPADFFASLKPVRCLACLSPVDESGRFFSRVWNDDRSRLYDIFFCKTCGLAYTYPFLSGEEEKKLYADYPAHHSHENIVAGKLGFFQKIKVFCDDALETVFFTGSHIAIKKILSGFLFPRIMQTPPFFLNGADKNKNILDVGCGDGHFLLKAKKFGYRCYGTEYSHAVIERLKSRGIEAARTVDDFITPAHNCAGAFDVIRINHVLEHVEDPDAVLASVHSLLSETGELIIGVPNFNTAARIFKQFFWLHLPYHRRHFTIKSLRLLLQKHNFSVSYVKTKSIGIFTSSLMRKYKNLKYSLLLRFFDVGLSIIMDAFNCGDCIELYAKKTNEKRPR